MTLKDQLKNVGKLNAMDVGNHTITTPSQLIAHHVMLSLVEKNQNQIYIKESIFLNDTKSRIMIVFISTDCLLITPEIASVRTNLAGNHTRNFVMFSGSKKKVHLFLYLRITDFHLFH